MFKKSITASLAALLVLSPLGSSKAVADENTPELDQSSPEAVMQSLQETFPDRMAEPSPSVVEAEEGLEIHGDSGTTYIPTEYGEPIRVAGTSITLSLPDAPASTVSGIEDDMVIHSDASSAYSTIATSASDMGVELYYLLNDAGAPSQFRTDLVLPRGGHLVQDDPKTVSVVDMDGATLLMIEAPWAVDAAGDPVAITLLADGDAVVTKVDHKGAGVDYPVLADPSFTTHGDNVHISSTAPRAVSGHGWWKVSCDCDGDYTATITIQLQWYHGGEWKTVETKKTPNVKPGGGSSRRAAAREQCSDDTVNSWRSIIDVDVDGVIDSRDKKTTPTQKNKCSP